MNAWLNTVSAVGRQMAESGPWLEVLLQSLIVMGVAAGWCWTWRRAAAATRHLIWFVATAGVPVLLALWFLPQSWHRPWWPISSGLEKGNRAMASLDQERTAAGAPSAAESVTSGRTSAPSLALAPDSASAPMGGWPTGAIFLVWAGGALLGLSHWAAGQLSLCRLRSNAIPLSGTSWGRIVADACGALGIRAQPELLLSTNEVMPLTWGWRRAKVLLPAEAADWPEEKRRIVLLHELAHAKRKDFLTAQLAEIIRAVFWVNPLLWLAVRRMSMERERACDDLVLEGGCKPSDYAAQLLEIARAFRHARFAPGIAMARSPQLEGRIAAIVDGSQRRALSPAFAVVVIAVMAAVVSCVGGSSGTATPDPWQDSDLYRQQMERLKAFAVAKEKQSEGLAKQSGEQISSEFREYFKAATEGDWREVTNRYEFFKKHNSQYAGKGQAIERLHTAFWQPVLELCLAYDHLANSDPKYTRLLAEEIIGSIPSGSIYFGGTDPGRGVPTAFMKSSIGADPFYCLTQNALADSSYLEYLRRMYGGKIYTPTQEDSQKCFEEYIADAQRRLQQNKLKPGEDVRVVDNRVQVSGQVAVMTINALLARVVFDRNLEREFYIEESFPLDWMYAHLEPHGLILKLNREPQTQLLPEILAKDRAYWNRLVTGMLGDAFEQPATVADVARFVSRVHARKELSGFKGDPRFIQNDYSKKIFSKLRSAIGGVYSWRLGENAPEAFRPANEAHRQQLTREADLAFRQAFALCPYSPEAVFRYVDFLVREKRHEDARLVVRGCLEVDPGNQQVKNLLSNLENLPSR